MICTNNKTKQTKQALFYFIQMIKIKSKKFKKSNNKDVFIFMKNFEVHVEVQEDRQIG